MFSGLHVDARGPANSRRGVLIHSDGIVGSDLFDRFGLEIPGYRVLAPDRSNFGGSRRSVQGGTGRSLGQLDDVAMIDDDAAEIAELMGDSAHLVGYSYGAVVALVIAARYTQRTRSLALIEPPAFQLVPDDRDAERTVARISAAVLEQRFDDPREYWRAFMTSAFGESPSPPDAIPLDRIEASRREQVPWDVEIDLAPVAAARLPTLVICGDWDPGFRAVARHLADQLSARLIAYQHANHFFMQNWGQIAREIRAFWIGVDELQGGPGVRPEAS